MAIKNVIFDNDDTLYRLNDTLKRALVAAFLAYASMKFNIPGDEVMPERHRLFKKYGVDSSAYLFAREYGIGYDEFVANTYLSVSPDRCGIGRDIRLRGALCESNLKMSVLTNNYSEYARKVIKCLGIEERFEHVMGFRELGFVLKPDPRAFLRAARITGYDLRETLFVDDKAEFLRTAKGLGMTTVHVSPRQGPSERCVDYRIDSISDISSILRSVV